MIHLGACLDRLQYARGENSLQLSLNSAKREELGSYDTIAKVHAECLRPSSLFAHLSFLVTEILNSNVRI